MWIRCGGCRRWAHSRQSWTTLSVRFSGVPRQVYPATGRMAPILVIYQIWSGARKRPAFGQVQINPRHDQPAPDAAWGDDCGGGQPSGQGGVADTSLCRGERDDLYGVPPEQLGFGPA